MHIWGKRKLGTCIFSHRDENEVGYYVSARSHRKFLGASLV